jgi:hypothetical protein
MTMPSTLYRTFKILLASTMLVSAAHAAQPGEVVQPVRRQRMPDRAPIKKVPALVVPEVKIAVPHIEAAPPRPAFVTESKFKQLVKVITEMPVLTKDKQALAVIIGDLSTSMGPDEHYSAKDPRWGMLANTNVYKIDALNSTISGSISDLIERNRYGEGVKNRVDVAVLGYHGAEVKGEETDMVRSMLGGVLNRPDPNSGKKSIPMAMRRTVATLSELDDYQGKTRTIIEGMEPQKTWFRAFHGGGTPTRKAIKGFGGVYRRWSDGKTSGRLILGIHVTDGEPTDGEPARAMAKLAKQVEERGDHLLMTNIHLSSNPNAEQLLFPNDDDAEKFDAAGKRLFEMSSLVPEAVAERLRQKGFDIKSGARMMAINATIEGFSSVFAAGSSVAAQ